MAYIGVMPYAGFDLTEYTIRLMGTVTPLSEHHIIIMRIIMCFLREIDVEPILIDSEKIFDITKSML